jgi:hypothetical protein
MHPEADEEPDAAAAANQQRSGTSVLAALAEQTQRTVEQQSRVRPPPAGPAAAAAAGAGGGEQMNAIVDVVMQHLLSKDVLYQPMKVRSSMVEVVLQCRCCGCACSMRQCQVAALQPSARCSISHACSHCCRHL